METQCVICVAEDDAAMRGMICKMLAAKGYRTVEAVDGRQVLREVARGGAHMVVLDIVMPNIEGLETIMALKKGFPDTRILAISGGGLTGDGKTYLNQARLMGADDTLLKPFEMDAFLAKIDALVAA